MSVANKSGKKVNSFAARLKQTRSEKGMTLEEFSKLIDIPAQTINRYELEQRVPKIDVVEKIAEKLALNPLWIQGYDVVKTGFDALSATIFGGNYKPEKVTFQGLGLTPPSKAGMFVIPKIGKDGMDIYVNKAQLEKIKKLLELAMPEIFDDND